jgi:4-hydroxybenzoate polyprenyltransferase
MTYGSFVIYIIFVCYTLARSMVDVERHERNKIRSFHKKGLAYHCATTGLGMGVYAILFYSAGVYTNQKIVWKAFFVVFCICGLISLICSVYFHLNKDKAPKAQPPIEIQSEFIKKKIKKRKVAWCFQILLLIFWIYSWYSVVA